MKLSKLTRDMRAFEDGMWVQPDPNEEVEFLARGATPKYEARRNGAIRRLVTAHGSLDATPAPIRAKILGGLLFEECILDVRGVTHEDGRAATLAEVRALACTPAGEPALNLAYAAVDRVTARRQADAEDAEGNSEPSSTGSEPGAETSNS